MASDRCYNLSWSVLVMIGSLTMLVWLFASHFGSLWWHVQGLLPAVVFAGLIAVVPILLKMAYTNIAGRTTMSSVDLWVRPVSCAAKGLCLLKLPRWFFMPGRQDVSGLHTCTHLSGVIVYLLQPDCHYFLKWLHRCIKPWIFKNQCQRCAHGCQRMDWRPKLIPHSQYCGELDYIRGVTKSYDAFMFAVVFGGALLAGTLIGAMRDIIDDPVSATTILAAKIPGTSIFFICFVIVKVRSNACLCVAVFSYCMRYGLSMHDGCSCTTLVALTFSKEENQLFVSWSDFMHATDNDSYTVFCCFVGVSYVSATLCKPFKQRLP